MSNTRVPRYFPPGLQALSNLTDSQVEELLAALSEHGYGLNTGAIIRQVRSNTPNLDRQDIPNIVFTLLSMYRAGLEYDYSISLLMESLTDDLGNMELSPAQQDILLARMPRLLDVDALKVSTKAFEVSSANERVYLHGRILTDIRPIFDDDASKSHVATLVAHTLRITYTDNDEERELYLALDDDGIEDLQSTLERAKQKAKSLNGYFRTLGVKHLESGRE